MSKALLSYVADLGANDTFIQNRRLNILAFVISTTISGEPHPGQIGMSEPYLYVCGKRIPRYDPDVHDLDGQNSFLAEVGDNGDGSHSFDAVTLVFGLPDDQTIIPGGQAGEYTVNTLHPAVLYVDINRSVFGTTITAEQMADAANTVLFSAPTVPKMMFKGWFTTSPYGSASWSQTVQLVESTGFPSALHRNGYYGCVSTNPDFTLADALSATGNTPCCGFRWRNFFQARRDPGEYASQGTVKEADSYFFNLLQPQYVPAVTVTFNARGGTSEDSLDSRTIELSPTYNSDGSVTYSATLGTLPTVTREGCTFTRWYINVGGRTATASTVITEADASVNGYVELFAQWIAPVQITIPVGVAALRSATPRTGIDPAAIGWSSRDVSPGDVVTLNKSSVSANPLRYQFRTFGGAWQFSDLNGAESFADFLAFGHTAYVVAYDAQGNSVSEINNPEGAVVPFSADTTTLDGYYSRVFVPIRIAAGVVSATYTIDGGEPVTVTPDAHGVAWIEDVVPGSVITVWGTPDSEDTEINATSDEPLVKTFSATSETTAGVNFFLHPTKELAFEVTFDNFFSFLEYLASGSPSISDGSLSRRRATISGDYSRAHYEYGFVMFGTNAPFVAHTWCGTGDCHTIPITTDEDFTLAADVLCAPIVDGALDTEFDAETADTSFDHCDVRAYFSDANGDLCVDGQGEAVYVSLHDEDANSVDFTPPDDATGIRVAFRVDPGYRADFINVRVCFAGIYASAITDGVDAESGLYADSASFIVLPTSEGPWYGSRHTIPAATREGYDEFVGWTAYPANTAVTATTPIVRSNLALQSNWIGNVIILMLNPMGGGFVKMVDGYAVPDNTAFRQRRRVGGVYGRDPGNASSPLPTPIRNGYTFAGWFTAASDGSLVTDSTVITAPSDHTLYAHWLESATAYRTLTFYAQGGTVAELSRQVQVGTAYGTLPTPTRGDYTFVGWFTDPAGGTLITSATIMGNSDADAFAHWSIHTLNVTFNANGGTCDEATRTIAVGSIIGALPIPERDGYNHTGWFSAATRGTQYDGSETPSANLTLYAQWDNGAIPIGYIKYKIKLNLDGGTVAASYGELKYIKGYAKALPTAEQTTKPGATFGGWYTSAALTGEPVTSIPASASGSQSFWAKWL